MQYMTHPHTLSRPHYSVISSGGLFLFTNLSHNGNAFCEPFFTDTRFIHEIQDTLPKYQSSQHYINNDPSFIDIVNINNKTYLLKRKICQN